MLILGVSGACIALAAWLLLSFLTSESFLTPRIEQELSKSLLARCKVEKLDFRIIRGALAAGLKVYPVEQKTPEGRPFAVLEGLRIRHSVPELVRAKYVPSSLLIQKATLRVTPEMLEWLSEIQKKPAPAGPVKWPLVVLQQGTIEVDLPELCEAFSIEGLNLQLSQDDRGRRKGSASFQINGNPFRLELTVPPAGGAIGLELQVPHLELEKLPRPGIQDEIAPLRELALSGLARGELFLHAPTGPGHSPWWRGDFAFESLRLAHPDWPAAATALSGRCHVTERGIRLEEIQGRLANGLLRIESAHADLRDGRIGGVALRGRIAGLDVTLLNRAPLPASVAGALANAGLTAGTADVEFNFLKEHDRAPIYDIAVNLRHARAEPKAIGIPLDAVRVKGRFASDGLLELDRAEASVLGGKVTVEGTLRQAAEGRREPDMTMAFTSMPVSPELLEKLPSPVAEIARATGVEQGLADGKVVLRGRRIELDLQVSGADIRSPLLPYRLKGVSADARWSSDSQQVVIRNFEGRHDEGVLHGTATVHLNGEPALDLMLDGDYLPIDAELMDLLPPADRERLGGWQPSGRFDFSLEMRGRPLAGPQAEETGLEGIDAEVRLRDVSISHADIGLLARGLNGYVRTGKDTLRISELTGEAMGVRFQADGTVAMGPESAASWLRIRTARTRITAELLASWPEAVRRKVQSFSPRGEFEIEGELRNVASEKGDVSGNLTVLLHDASWEIAGIPICTPGEVRLAMEMQRGKELTLRGIVRLDRVGVGPIKGSDFRATVGFEHNKLSVPFCDLSAYGGKIVLEDAALDMAGTRWNGRARISRVDLKSMMADLAGARAGTRRERRNAPSGVLNADFEFEGKGYGIGGLSVESGELEISTGRLYTLPMVLSVFNVLDLKLPSESPVSDAYVLFDVKESTLHIKQALLTGGTTPIGITGTVGLQENLPFKDQPLDLTFNVIRRKGILDKVPIVNWAKYLTLDQLRKSVLQARVVGTLGEHGSTSVLRPITAPIRGMWDLLQKLSPSEPEQ